MLVVLLITVSVLGIDEEQPASADAKEPAV
jgi:hypothetical protein